MNQPYRVRLKTKIKVRLGLLILALGFFLYFIVSNDFGYEKNVVRYGKVYLLEAIEKRSSGSYRGSTPSTYGRFKLPSGKVVSAEIYIISHNGLYCIAEVLVNREVSHYQTLKEENCA